MQVFKYQYRLAAFLITLASVWVQTQKNMFLLNFAPVFLGFPLFHLFNAKNMKKSYFIQRLKCAVPKHWSKYTTYNNTTQHSLCIYLLQVHTTFRRRHLNESVESWKKTKEKRVKLQIFILTQNLVIQQLEQVSQFPFFHFLSWTDSLGACFHLQLNYL